MKTLFIVHETSRTGACLQLLETIKQYQKIVSSDIDLLILNNADRTLLGDFLDITPNCYFYKKKKTSALWKNFRNREKTRYITLADIVKKKYKIIFGNTIISLPVLAEIKSKIVNCTAFLHCHEPKSLILDFSKHFPFEQLLNSIDYCIAVSDFVKNTLLEDYHFPEDRLVRIYPFYQNKLRNGENFLDEEITKDQLVITTIGNPHEIKGTDLLPNIAEKLRSFNINFIIIQIGGLANNDFLNKIKNTIAEKKLEKYFYFLESSENLLHLYKKSDIFLMISRQESFSLVTIEAIENNVPVISFRNNGGPNEILGKDYPFYANFLDTDDVVRNIIKITKNRTLAIDEINKIKINIEQLYNKEKNINSILQFILSKCSQ